VCPPGTTLQDAGRVAHLVRPVQGVHDKDHRLGPQRGEVLLVAHGHGGDAGLVGVLEGGAQQFVHLQVLIAPRADVVGTGEVHRLDPVQIDEAGHIDHLGPARCDLVEFAGIDDHVVAFAEVVALDDVVRGDLPAGALVDAFAADAVRAVPLQLMEVHGVVLGRRVQTDRDGDQSEGENSGPDGSRHLLPPPRSDAFRRYAGFPHVCGYTARRPRTRGGPAGAAGGSRRCP
jgi:hypothetical protein